MRWRRLCPAEGRVHYRRAALRQPGVPTSPGALLCALWGWEGERGGGALGASAHGRRRVITARAPEPLGLRIVRSGKLGSGGGGGGGSDDARGVGRVRSPGRPLGGRRCAMLLSGSRGAPF